MADDYDPTPVLELARQQYPEDLLLHRAIAECTTVVSYCACGCGTPYFVDLLAESAGEESEFGLRVTLERPDGGTIAIDLLPDGRVACIEG